MITCCFELLSKTLLHALTCHWLLKAKACQGMPRFNPISKYSGNWSRSFHLNIIRWPCGR